MPPLGTLLLGLALLCVIGLIIALPLFERRRPAVKPLTRHEALHQERRDIVRAIRELDFDHRTGKINDEDYQRVRADYVQRGAQILRELNEAGEPSVDAAIEKRVAALRATSDAQTCPACNKTIHAGDKFCPHCGQRLEAEAMTPAAT
jgi:type II secretory pathway component PulM